MDINYQEIFEFLSKYGYFIMFPLMMFEGPVTTLIAAMLAKAGQFNVFVVFFLSVLGDVLGDVIFYFIGLTLGNSFIQKFGKYIGIKKGLIARMKKYFQNHGGKTIFAVKATSGLCWATFATAGIIRMNFWRFLLFSTLGGFIWSGFLVGLGYFHGYMWEEIDRYLGLTKWIIPIIAIIVLFIIQKARAYKIKKSSELNS